MPDDRTWVTPLPPHLLDLPVAQLREPGELTVNILGDTRAYPDEIGAGSLQVPADALGETSRQAVRLWLETAAPDLWKVIHDFQVVAPGGLVLYDWLETDESHAFWLERMGLLAE
jgi:hypothetical protein